MLRVINAYCTIQIHGGIRVLNRSEMINSLTHWLLVKYYCLFPNQLLGQLLRIARVNSLPIATHTITHTTQVYRYPGTLPTVNDKLTARREPMAQPRDRPWSRTVSINWSNPRAPGPARASLLKDSPTRSLAPDVCSGQFANWPITTQCVSRNVRHVAISAGIIGRECHICIIGTNGNGWTMPFPYCSRFWTAQYHLTSQYELGNDIWPRRRKHPTVLIKRRQPLLTRIQHIPL